MHDCDLCGWLCDCDGEDMQNPCPPNCIHACEEDACDEDEP